MSKDLANFLDQFRLIKEKHDAVATANGERFNIFSVLGMESDEMKTHSALITDLLNPNGTHSQGAVFVRLFFTMLRDEFPNRFKWELTDDEINGFEVTAEAHRDDCGRIDILMESPGKCIIIENKIYAGDQERQLGRYYEYAMGKFAKENIVVIYLTLWGNEPNDCTLGKNLDKEKVWCVSYSQHIIKWLEHCLKETMHIAHIRETLFQYQSLLRKLTSQTFHRKFIMDTNKLFSENKNHELVPELEEAIKAFKVDLQFRFWEDIAKKLKETFKDKDLGELDDQLVEVRKYTENYYKLNLKDRHHYSIGFSVFPIRNHVEVSYNIAIDRNIYHGFLIRKEIRKETIFDDCNKKEYKKYREAVPETFNTKRNRWYLGYKYYEYNNEKFDFTDFSEALIQKMVCDTQRKDIAGRFALEIQKSVKSFLQAME